MLAGKWRITAVEPALPCPTLSDPMDCSLPGSSVHRIFQARVLEWGAIAFSGTIREQMVNAQSVQSLTLSLFCELRAIHSLILSF